MDLHGWHLVKRDGTLRYNMRDVRVLPGETVRYEGVQPVSLCVRGLHACFSPYDTLGYNEEKAILCRVTVGEVGEVAQTTHYQSHPDKYVGHRRTVLWMVPLISVLAASISLLWERSSSGNGIYGEELGRLFVQEQRRYAKHLGRRSGTVPLPENAQAFSGFLVYDSPVGAFTRGIDVLGISVEKEGQKSNLAREVLYQGLFHVAHQVMHEAALQVRRENEGQSEDRAYWQHYCSLSEVEQLELLYGKE